MLIFMDSFDHYATADITKKWTAIGGTPAINATAGRRGGGALRATAVSQHVTKTLPAAIGTVIVGTSVKFSAIPTAASQTLICLLDAGTAQCEVRVNPDGALSVTRNATALTGGASTIALSPSTEYYIEFKVTIADAITAGSCKVRVNGVDAITVATSQDTKNTVNATINQVRIGPSNGGSSTTTIDFDDVYICDTSGTANNDFLGDVRIDMLLPSADGTYSQFTPSTGTSHFALVDEAAPNTTDYNDGLTAGDRDSYAMANLAPLASQVIYGVQVNAAALKDDAGAKSAATMVRSGTVNGDGESSALGTTQVYVSQVFEKDPNGAVAWTESSVNAMEAGVIVMA